MTTIIQATACRHFVKIISQAPPIDRVIRKCPMCLSKVGRPRQATLRRVVWPELRRVVSA